MTVTVEQLDAWRTASSEDAHLEFKAARTSFSGDRLKEYCVALANEGGGVLILGVANDPPRPVVGTQACADAHGMVASLLNSLGFLVEIDVVAHPAGRVVVISVPR